MKYRNIIAGALVMVGLLLQPYVVNRIERHNSQVCYTEVFIMAGGDMSLADEYDALKTCGVTTRMVQK